MTRTPPPARRLSTAANLASLSSLGPKSAQWLASAGITSVAELKRVGAVEAYGRVQYQVGKAATRNLLYALDAAIRDIHWTSVTEADKRRLCRAADIAPPVREKR